jgi:hypothetical protein
VVRLEHAPDASGVSGVHVPDPTGVENGESPTSTM